MGIKHRRKFKEKKLQSPSDHRATMKTTTSITKHHNNHQPASDNCLSLSSPDLQIHFQIKSGDSIQTTLLTHCRNLNPNNPKKLPLVSCHVLVLVSCVFQTLCQKKICLSSVCACHIVFCLLFITFVSAYSNCVWVNYKFNKDFIFKKN